MSEEFVTIQDIIEQWGFSGTDDPNGPESAVMTLLRKIKAPAIRRHPLGKRGVMGLTEKQFEKANILRYDFNTAEAAKPAKPPARKPVTPAEFEKIKADAVANGFMDLHVIGKAWGMKWAKTLEYMHFLDPTTKDTVQLIQGSIERMNIPQSERRGLYRPEFDRLTAIGKQRSADQKAEADSRRALVDAETERLHLEVGRMKKARQDHFEAWDRKLKDARALVEIHWTEYNAAVLVSRSLRAAAILKAEVEHENAVDPLIAELRAGIEELGEEPEDGPRFSQASENWWIWQHARNNQNLRYASKKGIHDDELRELIEDARTDHRQLVWGLRRELRVKIRAPKKAAYKIFKEGPGPFDASQFDLKSRV